MDPLIAVIAAIVGYLMGSLSFARIVTHFVAPDLNIGKGVEIEYGEGSEKKVKHLDAIAGTAVSAELGDRWGCVTALGDIFKALIPALVFRLLFPDPATPYYLISAGMALVGHDWPIYYRFKGGRGLSPIVGGYLVTDPLGFVAMSLLSTVLGLVVVRGMYGILFAYAGVLILMVPWMWFRWQDPYKVAYSVWVLLVFGIAMIPDIKEMQQMKREGFEMTTEEMLDSMPMGRGIEKIKSFFRRKDGGGSGDEAPVQDEDSAGPSR